MSRCRTWTASVAVLIIVAAALVAVALPQTADASPGLRGQLLKAKHALRVARQRLQVAEAALLAAGGGGVAAAPESAGPETPAASLTLADLKTRVARARRLVRRWTQRVQQLATQYRTERKLAEWERHAKWMPIIEIAAKEYGVRADGIYRMMMRESGGRRTAGADSPYKGLFQYWTGTWSSDWNPWRHDSIYDGSSQIYATCYAVSKGWGPQFWTTTFASQY